MTELSWSNYQWIPQERWGQIHPEKSHWWYDPTQVLVDDEGLLHLKTDFNPKFFDHLNKTSNIGVGLVSCTSQFKFGLFEIKAKLPYGKNLWPAFWMWSWDSWPPEIDIFEGFSDFNADFSEKSRVDSKSLLRRFFNRKTNWKNYIILPNIHKQISSAVNASLHGGLLNAFQPSNFKFDKDPTANFLTYQLKWTEDNLTILYENVIVLNLNKKNSHEEALLLEHLAQHSMNVVINNGVTSFVNVNKPPKSDFVIEHFTYSPL